MFKFPPQPRCGSSGGQHFDCLPATVDVCQLGLQHVLGLRWHQLSLPLLRHVFARDQGAAEHQDWAKRLEGSKTLFAHFIPSPVHIQDPSPLLPPCFQGGVNVPNRIKGGWDFHRFGILLPMIASLVRPAISHPASQPAGRPAGQKPSTSWPAGRPQTKPQLAGRPAGQKPSPSWPAGRPQTKPAGRPQTKPQLAGWPDATNQEPASHRGAS